MLKHSFILEVSSQSTQALTDPTKLCEHCGDHHWEQGEFPITGAQSAAVAAPSYQTKALQAEAKEKPTRRSRSS